MPTDRVSRVDYWYAVVPADPGAVHGLLRALGEANVDLFAYLAFPLPDGRSQIDLFPRDGAALERATKARGVALSSRKQALFVEGSNRAGALAEHLSRLSTRGIHVVASTAIATAGGGYGFLIFVRPESVADAAKALGAA
jgi:hypothetical protein